MAAPQNFRSALNGFNREDVVHYLEYINTKHQNQVNQLTAEAEELRTQLEAAQSRLAWNPGLEEKLAAMTRERDELRDQLEALQQRCNGLEEETKDEPEVVEQQQESVMYTAADELEAYRRAERTERMARERAELVYHQTNGVLSEATAKVDCVADEITGMADQVMAQLTQLQVAVSNSKQALQDAASIMNAIRPNNK